MGRQRVGMSQIADDALVILGQEVRFQRTRNQMTIAELAARAGVSARTVSAVEAGLAATAVGNVFNVATAAGVPLFSADEPSKLSSMRSRSEERVALIPKRVEHARGKADDGNFDF